MNLKKTLSIISYYVLPIVLAIFSLTIPDRELFSFMGQVAQILVIIILFLKPVVKILRIKFFSQFLIYRRQLGVASFWFFAFHALGFWQLYSLTNINSFTNPQRHLMYGALAAIGMTILAITSNNWSVKKLKTNWKKIQYLAYPTLFLILYHAALSERELGNFYIIGGLWIILKIIAWFRSK